jgi:hypothetical protein
MTPSYHLKFRFRISLLAPQKRDSENRLYITNTSLTSNGKNLIIPLDGGGLRWG